MRLLLSACSATFWSEILIICSLAPQMALCDGCRPLERRLRSKRTMAVALDRNNELALKQLGQIMLFQGDPAAGIPHLEKLFD